MKLLLVLISLFIQNIVLCQENKLLPDSTIELDASKGSSLLEDCSGSKLQNAVDSLWIPSQSEYQQLQLNFYKLTSQLQDLNKYIIQYTGITLEGKKYIYLNAFHKSAMEDLKRAKQDLKSSAVIFCGGGIGFWRILFDLNLKEFHQIRINAPK